MKKNLNTERTTTAVATTEVSPWDVIPPHLCDGIYVSTREKLLEFGSNNLSFFLQYWRKEEQELSKKISWLTGALNELDGLTVAQLQAKAKFYLSPQFAADEVKMVPTYDGLDRPKPTNELSRRLNYGDTTFNLCGWCHYAKRSLCFHGYSINPCCGLKYEYYAQEGQTNFDQPCLLTHGTQENLDAIIQKLKDDRQYLLAQRAPITKRAQYLAALLKDAVEKPYLPHCRPVHYFRRGDQVVYFVNGGSKWRDKVLPGQQHQFLNGLVIGEFGDSWPKVRFATQVLREGQDQGYSVNLYDHSAHLLKAWEYSYLQEDPDFRALWLHCAAEAERGEEVMAMGRAFASDSVQ